MEKFEKYFKMPFNLDTYSYDYVWNKDNNQMVLMFSDNIEDVKLKEAIVNTINRNTKEPLLNGIVFTNPNQDDEIFMNGKYLMCIRGWGFLTGKGGANLSAIEAAKIQDSLVDFILKRLNQ